MKTITRKLTVAGAGMFLAAALAAHADTVYDNSSYDSGYSLSFANGRTNGNEIVLGGGMTSATITNFSFELYSSLTTVFSGSVQMRVFLYANDGGLVSGYKSPGTVLFDSGLFSLQPPSQFPANGSSLVGTVNFNLLNDYSPVSITTSNFTFAAVVTGLVGGDNLGFELFTNASVGLNYGDYWSNDGTGWQLLTTGQPNSIGAQFEATPEPSTLCLAAVGGSFLIGSAWRRRQANK